MVGSLGLSIPERMGFVVQSSGGFSPTSLFSGEEGFVLDVSDLSTLWKDEAGTDPVTADGDAVARIDDLNGNYSFTQATASNRPLYKTDGTLHWLLFDNSDDDLAASLAGYSDPVTTILGLRMRTATGFSGSVIGQTSGNPGVIAMGNETVAQFQARFSSTSLSLSATGHWAFDEDWVLGQTFDSGVSTFWYNETTDMTSVSSAGTGAIAAHTLLLGEGPGGATALTLYGAVRIARNLTAQEWTDTHAWMNERVGI